MLLEKTDKHYPYLGCATLSDWSDLKQQQKTAPQNEHKWNLGKAQHCLTLLHSQPLTETDRTHGAGIQTMSKTDCSNTGILKGNTVKNNHT